MTLDKFFKTEQGRARRKGEWAKAFGIRHATYLSQILSGHKTPSLQLARRIEKVTGGAVTASEALGLPPPATDSPDLPKVASGGAGGVAC